MSGYLEGLSKEQSAALDDFLKSFKLPARENVDANELKGYLQFLRARKFNVKKSADMYKKSMDWRKEMHVDTILGQPDQPEKKSDKEEIWRRLLPHAYSGFDHDGRPVYIEKIGVGHFPTITSVLSLQDLEQLHIRQMERLMKMCKESTAKTGKYVETMTCIFDLKGLNMSHRHGLKFIQMCAKIDQDNYPERMGKLYVINAPRVFPFFWKICSRWVDEKTRNKINVLSNKKRDKVLRSEIPAHFLPKEYGGTAPDIPVTDLKELKSYIKYACDEYDSKAHSTVNVPARDMTVLRLEPVRDGSGAGMTTQFQWNFKCTSKNVSFAVVAVGPECDDPKGEAIELTRNGAQEALTVLHEGKDNPVSFTIPEQDLEQMAQGRQILVAYGDYMTCSKGTLVIEEPHTAAILLVFNNEYSMMTGKEVRALCESRPYEPTPSMSLNSRSASISTSHCKGSRSRKSPSSRRQANKSPAPRFVSHK